MKAGRMDQRVELMEPVRTKDGYGDERTEYVARAMAWAEQVRHTGSRSEDVTGKDFSEFDASKTSDTIAWIWYCAVSASKREGKQFPLTMEEMADMMTVEDMNDCLHSVSSGNVVEDGTESAEEKKSHA